MDIKETGKKLKPFAPVLSVALVTACVAGSLSGYEAPVYAATQEETPVKKEETKEKKEEKKTAAKGSFDLEDGVYKGTGTGYAGDITVSVLIKDKQIVSIDILSSSDDAAFFHACESGDRQDYRRTDAGCGYCIGSNVQFQRNHQRGKKCADRGKGYQ